MLFKYLILIFFGLCVYWDFFSHEIDLKHLKRDSHFFIKHKKQNVLNQQKYNEKRKTVKINTTNLIGKKKAYLLMFNEINKNRVYLFPNLKKCFSFFKIFGKDKDEKYLEDVKASIYDLKRIKQLTLNKKKKYLNKNDLKQLLLHTLFSKINFRIINNISYILKQLEVETNTIKSILNEISKQINSKQQAHNFLTLYFFLLKNENIALFLMIHILDFFGSKRDVLELLQNIKEKIYQECVSELLKKKIERYILMCEEKKRKMNLYEAIEMININEKEDDLYFHYDKELIDTFNMKKNNLKWKAKNGELNKRLYTMSSEKGSVTAEEQQHSSLNMENETIEKLKETYKEIYKFKEKIIQYVEKDQQLFYFTEDMEINRKAEEEGEGGGEGEGGNINKNGDIEVESEIDLEKKSKNIMGNSNTSYINKTNIYTQTESEKEREKENETRKNIDNFLEQYMKGSNKNIENFKNYFIEQASINFKIFLANLKESTLSEKKRNDEHEEEDRKIHNKTNNDELLTNLNNTTLENKFHDNYNNYNNNNIITDFQLKKLNISEYDLDLTKEKIAERIRIKIIYLIQKMEYLKYKYHYDIINERYPLFKNEKTILDILQYGYKIIISPHVDNSMFQNEKRKKVATFRNIKNGEYDFSASQIPLTKKYYHFKCIHCHYYIFYPGNKESSEKVFICPQCKTKV